jgi:hypothetical protein
MRAAQVEMNFHQDFFLFLIIMIPPIAKFSIGLHSVLALIVGIDNLKGHKKNNSK